MTIFDLSANSLISDGHLISPNDALLLEKQCSENSCDFEARWKLLGFYNAHQLCCPQNRIRRIENIVWIIDNTAKPPKILRSYLMLGPGERPCIQQVRAAWQRRIDTAPDDPDSYHNMGDFLQTIFPGEACSYYEKALALNGDKATIERDLDTTRHLEKHGADATSEDYGQDSMTCFFEVLQAGDILLEETRNRMQPSEADWNKFSNIVHPLIWSPMLHLYAQFGDGPRGGPAPAICKSALRQVDETFDAELEVRRELNKAPLKALWKDLIKP